MKNLALCIDFIIMQHLAECRALLLAAALNIKEHASVMLVAMSMCTYSELQCYAKRIFAVLSYNVKLPL